MTEFSAALEAVNQSAAALTAEYEALEPRVDAVADWLMTVTSPYMIRVAPSNDPAVNAANLRAAIALIRANFTVWSYGGTILLKDGIWVLNETIEFREMWGIRLLGDSRAVEIKWRGPADAPVFRFEHCRDFEVAQLRMLAEMPWYAGIQIRRDNTPPSVIPPRFGYVHDLYIDCNGKGANGIVIGGVGAADANNDFHEFARIQISAYTNAAFFATGMQPYGLQFNHCEVWGNGIGKYAFLAGGEISPSFTWRDGSIFANTVADFSFGRTYRPIIIDGATVEGSKRLLDLPANGGFRIVLMRGVRWSAGGLHADNRAIVVANNIKLILEGCAIGDGGGEPARAMQLDFGVAAGNYHYVEMRGCSIISSAPRLWTNAAPDNDFQHAGNTHFTSEATLATIPIAP